MAVPSWTWAIALGALATIAGAAYWLGTRPVRPASTADATFRRRTKAPGPTTGAAISPEGKLFAYSSDRGDPSHLDIWIQQVDGGGLVQITNDAADHSDPAFSPDGTQIAFRSERGEGGIYAAPTIGGEARLLIPEGKRPRFSPDGRMLMYWTGPEPHDVRGSSEIQLWVRSVTGGAATQIWNRGARGSSHTRRSGHRTPPGFCSSGLGGADIAGGRVSSGELRP